MFTVTIKDIQDKQLGQLIAQIGTKRWLVHLTHHPHPQVDDLLPTKKRVHMTSDTILSLTGKKATKGSMRERCLEAMELLEKEHGIGNVTRGRLKQDLVDKGLDKQVLYQLVREGYLKRL